MSDDEVEAYLDHLLAPEAVARLQRHIDHCHCARCRVLVATAAGALAPEGEDEVRAAAPRELPVVPDSHDEAIEELARGGLGRILRARDVRLGRVVALKELRADARKAEKRFLREALITARLEHPSSVLVHEAAVGRPASLLRWCRGARSSRRSARRGRWRRGWRCSPA